LKYQK
jgi:hypothetical protein